MPWGTHRSGLGIRGKVFFLQLQPDMILLAVAFDAEFGYESLV
jgi:hypothetical protein